jgi:hypothetical protein
MYFSADKRFLVCGTLKKVPDESVFLKYLMERLEENSENVPELGEVKNSRDEGGDFILIRRK